MRVDQFDFTLPEALIATEPVSPRDAARLLMVGQDTLQDGVICDLPDCLQPGDVMVFNNTEVIPARLKGKRGEAGVEITLHQYRDGVWSAFAKPARKLHPGDQVDFAPGFSAEVQAKGEGGEVNLAFNVTGNTFDSLLAQYGIIPLPPYIAGRRAADSRDVAAYQTVYAQEKGAVAAPTAGLHFTPELLERLRQRGIHVVFVTLHVGAGTFLPVKVEDTQDHRMHSEWYRIEPESCAIINQAKAAGHKVIAVGTTSLRVLESIAGEDGKVPPTSGETDIFITPGYRFKCVDRLLTNFHIPRSTLFMLVCAFAGYDAMHGAYRHAIAEHYRFYSYGDACLLDLHKDG